MLFSIQEIIDMFLMTFIVGYIFKDAFPSEEHPAVISIDYLQQQEYRRFVFAVLAVAPAILLHEMGHKFAAFAFGINATFEAAYSFLLIGALLKALGFPFIFFVPAYVRILGRTTPMADISIALAGPLLHAIVWAGARYALHKKMVPKKYRLLVFFTKYINGFLFVLNMLPIPGFDGFHVLSGIFRMVA